MIAKLLAQRGDVRVDRLRWAVPVGVPPRLEDLRSRVNCADVVRQERQQVELLGGQRQLLAADANTASSAVQLHRPDRLRATYVAVPDAALAVDGSPTDGTDPSNQLPEAERFGDVVVRAQLEAEHAVELLASRGQHDDGCCGPSPQLAGYVAPVHVRESEIEQDQFVAVFRKCAGAGRHVSDSVACRSETLDQCVGDRSVVLDQQQLHAVIVTSVPTRCGFLDGSWIYA